MYAIKLAERDGIPMVLRIDIAILRKATEAQHRFFARLGINSNIYCGVGGVRTTCEDEIS